MIAATVQAADIEVMCDSPLAPALTKVVDVYIQQTQNHVSLVFDPSPAVKKRIEPVNRRTLLSFSLTLPKTLQSRAM